MDFGEWVRRFVSGAKYIMGLQLAALAVAVIFYFVVSLPAGVIAAVVGLLLIQGYFHARWLYDDLDQNDSYRHSPLVGAIIGVLGLYALGTSAGITLLVLAGVLSSVMGVSLYMPMIVLMIVGFFMYTYKEM